jgi:vacuolar-type H+-ATPase subunit I/STV1
METKLSKQLQDANNYFEQYKIEKTVSDVLNKTVQSQDKNPLAFMIRCLADITPPEVLENNGIVIQKLE